MKNLFLKLFLLSWVINTAVFFAFIVLAEQTGILAPRSSDGGFPARDHMPRIPGAGFRMPGGRPRMPDGGSQTRRLVLYGRETIAALRSNGIRAAEEYLAVVQQRSAMRIFVFDEKANEILNRVAPEAAIRQVEKILKGGPIERGPSGDRWVGAEFTTRDGSRFVAMARRANSIATMLLRRPRMLITRLVVSVFVASIVALVLAYWIAHPVQHLRTATVRFAAGDLTARAGPAVVKRKDAIGDLGRDFDRMAVRIEALLTSQQRLLRDVSHELRSPLARLNVALGIAARQAGPEAHDALARIEYEAERLNDLIGQLLTLTYLESSPADLERSEIDLATLVQDVVSDANFEAQGRNTVVRIVRCESPIVLGIEHLLRSAIENLMRNSVIYASPGTDVEVEVGRRDDRERPYAFVSIRDHGPGIPEDQLKSVFRPFYRIDEARDRSRGGAGLGLAIADRAVRLHDGTITASNAPEGGLIVELRIPTTPIAPSDR